MVMPLEGLWRIEHREDFSIGDKSNWKWTAMIRQPDFITNQMIKKAMEEVKEKKNFVALPKIRFKALNEGLLAQIMHFGPYSEEGLAVERLNYYVHENIYEFDGRKDLRNTMKYI
ncbi:MAG: hypothetical protein ACP5C3_01890 [Methanomicrobiales archaeon]